jgi:F0F1-type ATP synthase delta subunit
MNQNTSKKQSLGEKNNQDEEKISHVDEVNIYSPHLLTEEERELLTEKFTFIKDKKIVNIVDKNLIGGFRLEAKEKVIDLSLRSRLNKLKNILYEISF